MTQCRLALGFACASTLLAIALPLAARENRRTTTTAKDLEFWQKLTPAIDAILDSTALGPYHSKPATIWIDRATDITGDGTPEALVTIRGASSAHSQFFTLVRLHDGKPVPALFRTPDGKTQSLLFLDGEGSAGRYGEELKLMNAQHAVFYGEFSAYGDKTDRCRASVYRWNPRTSVFEFSPALSTRYRREYSREKSWKKIRAKYGF